MLAKHSALIRLLMPSLGVAVLYGAIGAMPKQRTLREAWARHHEQSQAVEQLRIRLQSLPREPQGIGAREPSVLTRTASPLGGGLSSESEERTFMQAFGQVLAIFANHGIQCTAANTDPADPTSQAKTSQRVVLRGSFASMLLALEQIEAQVPQAIAEEFSMTRTDPSVECQWEIAFQFVEASE